MRRKNERPTDDADLVIKDIKRQTRRRYSAEDKIRIVLAGLRREARDLKEVVAEQALELRLLKKSVLMDREDEE